MARPDQQQLVAMALAALEEIAALARHRPQPQSRGVALALAYLAHVSSRTDRWPFDAYWRALTLDCDKTRAAHVSAPLNAIYEAVGWTREIAAMSKFEQQANAIYGPLQPR